MKCEVNGSERSDGDWNPGELCCGERSRSWRPMNEGMYSSDDCVHQITNSSATNTNTTMCRTDNNSDDNQLDSDGRNRNERRSSDSDRKHSSGNGKEDRRDCGISCVKVKPEFTDSS